MPFAFAEPSAVASLQFRQHGKVRVGRFDPAAMMAGAGNNQNVRSGNGQACRRRPAGGCIVAHKFQAAVEILP